MAEAAQHGLKVSPLAQILLIVLVLGAGTDYGLFLVFRVRENLRAGLDRRQAVIAAVERVGESITFSAATVIAALLSLLAATFEFYSDLGIPLAIGIGVMLLAGLTLLPALMAVFGRAVFWPSKTQAGTGKAGVWGRVSVRIVSHPVPTLVTGLVAFGGLAFAVTAYTAAGFGGQTNAPSGSDSAAGTALLSAHFPNTSANPTNIIYQLRQPVWNDLQAMQTARSQLEASGLFTGVTGPLNPNGATLTPAQLTALHDRLGPPQLLPSTPPAGTGIPAIGYQLYRATALYISPDGRTVQFETGLKAGDPSTTAAMNAIPAVRTEAATVMRSIGAADYGVGGQAPAIYDISSISNSDLATVIPIAIVVIGFLLALVMRSLVAPLYLIFSVGLSYLAALGLSVLLFVEIAGDGGLVFFLPFLMFIFLLALGEDYNILVMSRIREEAQHLPLKEAVSRALVATGTTVTSAGLVLGGTFSVFAIVGAQQGSTQFRDVGAGLALGVLMDTFLVRTLLVPSTVVLLGRWNWWPSAMSRPGAGLPGTPAAPPRASRKLPACSARRDRAAGSSPHPGEARFSPGPALSAPWPARSVWDTDAGGVPHWGTPRCQRETAVKPSGHWSPTSPRRRNGHGHSRRRVHYRRVVSRIQARLHPRALVHRPGSDVPQGRRGELLVPRLPLAARPHPDGADLERGRLQLGLAAGRRADAAAPGPGDHLPPGRHAHLRLAAAGERRAGDRPAGQAARARPAAVPAELRRHLGRYAGGGQRELGLLPRRGPVHAVARGPAGEPHPGPPVPQARLRDPLPGDVPAAGELRRLLQHVHRTRPGPGPDRQVPAGLRHQDHGDRPGAVAADQRGPRGRP